MTTSPAPITTSHWLTVSAPPVLAGALILFLASVGTNAYALLGASVALALGIAVFGSGLARRWERPHLAWVALLAPLMALAGTMLVDSSGPTRWLPIGPLSLYVAPVVLPVFLAACNYWILQPVCRPYWAGVALVAACGLLAAQPDASQALALLVGSTLVLVRSRNHRPLLALAFVLAALATAWAWTRPDPLQPVPHVEEVFALAFDRSWLAGAAVLGSAVWLVVGLQRMAAKTRPWLGGVAAYYAVLYACSTAGLTPAPLIGLGAGPLLGFGLLAMVTAGLDSDRAGVSGP